MGETCHMWVSPRKRTWGFFWNKSQIDADDWGWLSTAASSRKLGIGKNIETNNNIRSFNRRYGAIKRGRFIDHAYIVSPLATPQKKLALTFKLLQVILGTSLPKLWTFWPETWHLTQYQWIYLWNHQSRVHSLLTWSENGAPANGGAAGPVAYNDLEIKQDLRRNNEWGGKVRKHCWQGKKKHLMYSLCIMST